MKCKAYNLTRQIKLQVLDEIKKMKLYKKY
jgi:hypothetical protein